jgi:hypothetical protein
LPVKVVTPVGWHKANGHTPFSDALEPHQVADANLVGKMDLIPTL